MEVSLGEESLEHGVSPQVKSRSNMPVVTAVKDACIDIVRPSLYSNIHRRNKPLGRTAYLDGLRGFAATLVYCLHNEVWGHSGSIKEFGILESAYGWNKQFFFACLPGVRILFSGGHLAVAIFFVISGYVLSAKPLSLIQAGETTQLADNLGSALFRRWLRLYIPVIATTFLWMSSWHLFGIRSGHIMTPAPEPTYAAEFWKWYATFKNYSFVFHDKTEFAYNDHTWSIALEFRGSLVVYTSLLAFSRCSRNARLWCEVGLLFYFLYIVDGWYCGLFVAGMLLSDLDLLAISNSLPAIFYKLRPFKNTFFYTIFAIGIYLGGVPSLDSESFDLKKQPGWYYLSMLKPQAVYDARWFYRFWAALFVMASTSQISTLKSFFETRFCQYLGKVSYGFYLVHGPVLWTIGDRVYAAVGRSRQEHAALVPGWVNIFPLPNIGPYGLELNFLLAQLILFPITLWLAEIVTKMIDTPSVTVSQWLYRRLLAPGERSENGLKRGFWEKP